jgi:hypothetical protein
MAEELGRLKRRLSPLPTSGGGIIGLATPSPGFPKRLLATLGIAGKGVVNAGGFCSSALLAAREIVVPEGVSGLNSSPAVMP